MNGINNNNLGRFKAFLESMGEFGNFSVIFYLGWEYFFDRSDSAPHHLKTSYAHLSSSFIQTFYPKFITDF